MKEMTLTTGMSIAEVKTELPKNESFMFNGIEVKYCGDDKYIFDHEGDEFVVTAEKMPEYVYATLLADDILLENQNILDSGKIGFDNALRMILNRQEVYSAVTSKKDRLDEIIVTARAYRELA